MVETRFTNRELTLMFDEIKDTLREHGEIHNQILTQVKYTNGKLKRLTLVLTVVATVTVTLLVTNGSEVLDVLKILI